MHEIANTARAKFSLESLCRSSLHFDAICEALLHADPITSILYRQLLKFTKGVKWCQLIAFYLPLFHFVTFYCVEVTFSRRNWKIRMYISSSEIVRSISSLFNFLYINDRFQNTSWYFHEVTCWSCQHLTINNFCWIHACKFSGRTVTPLSLCRSSIKFDQFTLCYMYGICTWIYCRDIPGAAHIRAGEKIYPRLNRKSISSCHIAITVRFSQKPETSHRSPVIQRGNFGSADPRAERPGKSFAAMQNRDSPSNDGELRRVLDVQKRRLRATFALSSPPSPQPWGMELANKLGAKNAPGNFDGQSQRAPFAFAGSFDFSNAIFYWDTSRTFFSFFVRRETERERKKLWTTTCASGCPLNRIDSDSVNRGEGAPNWSCKVLWVRQTAKCSSRLTTFPQVCGVSECVDGVILCFRCNLLWLYDVGVEKWPAIDGV